MFRRLALVAPLVSLAAACGTHQQTSSVKGDDEAYKNAKPVLDKFCTRCHGGERPAAKLVLTAFPFVSATMSDQALIAAKIKTRIHDELKPMPPKTVTDRPTADELALLDKLAD
jgi:uncharacterized membrane protein